MSDNQLTLLMQAVLSSPKYKSICPDLVSFIGRHELAKRRNLKEAVKATKNKLHQVGGAYLPGNMPYADWLAELQAENSPHPHPSPTGRGENPLLLNLRPTCARILNHHASTRERLPLLDHFYATILAGLPPLRRVVDLACGLNPLTLPWLPLPAGAEYYAYDIYQDMMDFISGFMALAGVKGRAEARDVLHQCPTEPADIVFLLKALPCLEQLDKAAAAALLDNLNAPYLLVSFPGHSLGGRSKGMAAHYTAHFETMLAGKRWSTKRFDFPGEVAFLVNR